jgi:hypothetical protein
MSIKVVHHRIDPSNHGIDPPLDLAKEVTPVDEGAASASGGERSAAGALQSAKHITSYVAPAAIDFLFGPLRPRPGRLDGTMDEIYVRVWSTWKYLYRAVDKAGATVDFLLTAKRDRKAALRFLRKAIKWSGTPEKITIGKSGANTAAIESHNAERETSIEIREIKYLNNIAE